MAMDDAFQMLGLDATTDRHAVEAAYWRRARELNDRRRRDVRAAFELDRLNQAYERLSRHLAGRPKSTASVIPARGSARRLFAVLAAAAFAGAVAVAGLTYRTPLEDAAKASYERGQDGWEASVSWLQSLNGEETPAPKAKPRKSTGPGHP